ncbi:MAG: hypothetical protein NWF00_01570 [Candidatus Bathyarchaeota archaeon]|nr:hypothetical protein [Candidatus Bathyarchaeota archaeon]
MGKGKRVVVEVSEEVHGRLRRLAIFNDLKLYVLVDALMEEALRDEEQVKLLIKRVKQEP